MNRMILEVHALQTVPSSNINRDESGSPKMAFYGGVQRARVSSQAWKRATREVLKDYLDAGSLGVRTLKLVEVVRDAILAREPGCEDAQDLAVKVLTAAGIKIKAAKQKESEDAAPQPGALFFISAAQADRLAEVALSDADAKAMKTEAQAALRADQSVDIALFGRMVADEKSLSVDAACQVAHAISVDAVVPEFDYYTAVDDLRDDDEAGAGMIGTIEFNSSTLYRYANLNVHALHATLGDEAATSKVAAAFVEAFVKSMPTGKQNTFANRTLPEAVVVMVRPSQPVNLVQAFEEPVVRGEDAGVLAQACAALAREAEETAATYAEKPIHTFVVRKGQRTAALATLGEQVTMPELMERLTSIVTEGLRGESHV